MTVIATALKHLMAAGVTGDALIAAISEIEAALPGAQPIEQQRSKAAIRQERYRRNKTSQNVTNGITNVTEDNASVTSDAERNADPLPLPPNDLISNPPTPAPESNSREREDADAHVVDWLAWWDKNPFPRPRFATASLWVSLKKNRKTKRLANTVAAWTKLLVDVDAYAARLRWPPGKVLEACVERGWGAIHETNEMKAILNANGNGGNQRSARQNHGGRDNRDGFKRALDDFIDEAERSAASGDGGPRQLALGGPGSL